VSAQYEDGMRELTSTELQLVRFLLASKGDARTVSGPVQEMDDGGMGSLVFPGPKGRRYGSTLAEAEFHDADGTVVSVALNLDTTGELFELDMWKIDFSPLIRIPPLDQITISK
jgi:hypothetical protein